MAGHDMSAAKVVLLAVHLASTSNITNLQTLVSQYRKTLQTELVLRILLTYLPESLDSSEYVPFLENIAAGSLLGDSEASVETSAIDELSEADARKNVRKLHPLPLLWPNAPEDAPTDPLLRFLIHRSLRIDEYTGIITQIPVLLAPFLEGSSYLQTWFISTILPLLRMNYEYHPEDCINISIPKFETLDDRTGVSLLLSKTTYAETGQESTVGRDMKGLVGPWMYGDTRWKRRKTRQSSIIDLQTVPPFDETHLINEKYVAWEEVFKWLTNQAETSWKTAVELVEQWDGPGDVDLGGYGEGNLWLAEDDQQYLERRYARSVLAAAYLMPSGSKEELEGIQRVLVRIITLLDKDRIPTLEAACALLSPVTGLESGNIHAPKNAQYLRSNLLDEGNVLTTPKEVSIRLLHALLISAFLCTRIGYSTNIRRAGELAFVQDKYQQEVQFTNFMNLAGNNPKREDDKYWIKMRNEILWLRSWGAEELSEGADNINGRGIFGQLPKEFIEVEILKALLANTRYSLAQSIYESSPDRPLSKPILHDTVIAAAMNQYDNATNANRTRGAVKKCNDILRAFPETMARSKDFDEAEHLLKLTHTIGPYRLVLKRGEPFKPVSLRIHEDPISILGKILEQNPKSYTQIGEFVEMGKDMVMAGLTGKGKTDKILSKPEQLSVAEKRIVSMCIDSALSEDDFETAYSYVSTRLKDIGGQAHARSPPTQRMPSGLAAEPPPKILDDWSWRAALQAGKYRRTSQTIKPTHFGNGPVNLDIRHLEQRMDCLSHALRMAPKGTLQEILNVYRRCEEELESLVQQEAEQEEAWDLQGDDKLMPGGFAATPAKMVGKASSSRGVEEAPMSLFDLSRASMARAQNGFSALSMLRGNNPQGRLTTNNDAEAPTTNSNDSPPARARKRDQLKNVAVGGLATGVGWLLGAQPVHANSEDEE